VSSLRESVVAFGFVKEDAEAISFTETSDRKAAVATERSSAKGQQDWCIERTHQLPKLLDEYDCPTRLLDTSLCTSVRHAVEGLNAGVFTADEGFCAVYSKSREAYFLVFRADKRDYCNSIFDIEN